MDGTPLFFALLILVLIIILYRKQPKKEKKPSKQYGIPSITLIGTPVKSNTERVIADYFTKNNIRYEYEPVLKGGLYGNKTMHPDFYLPDYNVYVEYWGLVDLPDKHKREQYVKEMRWKMAQYHSRNIKFISIYPYNMNDLDSVFPRKFEELTGNKIMIYPNSLDAINLPDGSLVSCRYCKGIIRKGELYCCYCGKKNP